MAVAEHTQLQSLAVGAAASPRPSDMHTDHGGLLSALAIMATAIAKRTLRKNGDSENVASRSMASGRRSE